MATLAAILFTIGGGPFSPGPLSAAQPKQAPLNGYTSHADFEEDCAQCHPPWRAPTAAECERCHTEIEAQRASDAGLHGHMVDAQRCTLCHSDHRGREALLTPVDIPAFDHEHVTGFSLAQHALNFDKTGLACSGCHTGQGYGRPALDCTNCHTAGQAEFMSQHRERYGDDCLGCHDGLDTMANFDHAQAFALDGAHVDLACERCHVARQFKGTARECAGCHAEPALHAGQFGLDCVRCHGAAAWRPAALTRHTFPLDHGARPQSTVECKTCHEKSYAAYSCYNCHEHDPAEIQNAHFEESIFDFAKCESCHADGK